VERIRVFVNISDIYEPSHTSKPTFHMKLIMDNDVVNEIKQVQSFFLRSVRLDDRKLIYLLLFCGFFVFFLIDSYTKTQGSFEPFCHDKKY